jgi:Phosphotransferase enzyme family
MQSLVDEGRQYCQINELKGHSGCRVFLCKHGNNNYVKKVSASASYNRRLERQMIRQQEFAHPGILSPAVYECGTENDLFYFTMEYIHGVSFSTFISRNTIRDIDPHIEQLFAFLRANVGDATTDLESRISEKLYAISAISPIPIERYLRYCLAFDWSAIPIGYCHGDLTCENILVRDTQLYLIDFLDSFADTPYLDASKLLQDILVMWSWRFDERRPVIKNMRIYAMFLARLESREMEIVRRMLILNLLRFLPYATAPRDVFFVRDALAHLATHFDL